MARRVDAVKRVSGSSLPAVLASVVADDAEPADVADVLASFALAVVRRRLESGGSQSRQPPRVLSETAASNQGTANYDREQAS
jgi:hypothetical protein